MIKEAIKYITDLKAEAMEPKVVTIAGKTYCDKDLSRYDDEPMAEPIEASNLSSMIDYILSCTKELRESMIIHVISPTKVELYSGLNAERKRERLFVCRAETPRFRYDEWYDQERFLIEMQANFEENTDLEAILKVSGNVEAKTTANYGDDGITQKTTIKQGIASKADVLVPNPVTLIPYRTFLEVKQPESEFVFRIKDAGGAPVFKIVEAEGGLWKNVAMKEIRDYFVRNLESEEDLYKRLTIIA